MDKLKHLRPLATTLALCAATLPGAAPADAETASATAAERIAVDTFDGEQRAVSPKDVEYSPLWCGEAEDGAYVVIEKVVHAGMGNAVTSTVTTCAADAEGDYSFAVAPGDDPCVRLIHRVYSSGGVELGETLVRDVAFGVASAPSSGAAADCRQESLREAVARRDITPVLLAYDTAWATNGTPASVAIESRLLDGEGGAVTGISPLFSTAAAACGATQLRRAGKGWMRLALSVTDSSDNILLEYVTGDFLLKDFATIFSMH